MVELIQAREDTDAGRRPMSAGRTQVARREWPTRGALFFWILASIAVWIALAASAIWIY